MRRSGTLCARCEAVAIMGITIDHERQLVSWPGGKAETLTRSQLVILRALAIKPCTNDQLINATWGDDIDGGPEDAIGAIKVRDPTPSIARPRSQPPRPTRHASRRPAIPGGTASTPSRALPHHVAPLAAYPSK
jgi:hypothetical protein